MGAHQIIYTSCMRGIDGINDGQQVFSYDAGFQDAGNDEIKSLFAYQHPAQAPGAVMSEELAAEMPKNFCYRRLKNGGCVLALNTYLGRDYMGPSGRFGNYLSHVIAFEPKDLEGYPAEYWGGGMLRTEMAFEEVNNPNRPDYLPEPVLERGFGVDVSTVTDFLSEGGRLEVYKNMLYAMLAFQRDRRRVVICDEPENIILWIAALEFALPRKNALNVNFSTYDYDPSLSAARICGVVPEGTEYTPESRRLHFTFDLLAGPVAEFEKDAEFFDFIDTAMSFSYESLQDFHTFLDEGYCYEDAGEELCDAYALYTILTDGVAALSLKRLDGALSFAARFAKPEERLRVIRRLLEEREALLARETPAFLGAVKHILSHSEALDGDTLRQARSLTVDWILREFLNEGVEEERFAALYEQIDLVCREHAFSVSTELMKEENREKLFTVMGQDIAVWKVLFVVRVISSYAKDQSVPVEQLSPEAPVGQLYYGILRAVYAQNRRSGFLVAEKILEDFSEDCVYLVNVALDLEGMLLDVPEGEQEAAALWERFGQWMLSGQSGQFDTAYRILGECRRYDLIYLLYSLAVSQAAEAQDCRKIFMEHRRSLVERDAAYAGEYRTKILETYYQSLARFDNPEAQEARAELCGLLTAGNTDVPFADELIEEVLQSVPLDQPSDRDRQLVRNIFQYTYNSRRKPVRGKALVLVIGLVLERIRNQKHFYEKLEQLEELTKSGRADLSQMTEQDMEDYFDWVLPNACALCQRTEDLEAVYDLYEMPDPAERMFFAQCARLYLKQIKGGKDHLVFCSFLGAMFHKASQPAKTEVGKVLCKLNKQKLEALDEAVTDCFQDDDYALRCWAGIRETAENTNPVLNSITSLFKRRRDG